MTEAPLPHDDEISLEDLAAVYARALGVTPPTPTPAQENVATGDAEPFQPRLHVESSDGFSVSPLAVVEAALFVGHPENEPLSAAALASLMRDVTTEEIESLVGELNEAYEGEGSALRVERVPGGYRLGLIADVDGVRTAFYGRAREARLTQTALDVLALIAYQPGVTANDLDRQRGKGSAGVAAQLIRRRLVELRRETDSEGRKIGRYFPTDRFLKLFSINSLDDLPHVGEDLLPPE